jgi:twitching motility protein PilI
MARRGGLTNYQDDLLRQMELARQESVIEHDAYFAFSAGGIYYLIEASNIDEVTIRGQMLPIPVAKPWVAGAANIKGTVCTVVDFSLFFGGKPTVGGKFAVLNPDLMQASALLIAAGSGLFKEDEVVASAVPVNGAELPSWVVGLHEIGGCQYRMIDADLLVRDARFSKLQSGEGV